MEIACFFCGILFFYTLTFYPLIITFIIWYLFRDPASWLCFIVAVAYCLIHEQIIQPSGIPDVRVIAKASLVGQIVSIPNIRSSKSDFIISVSQFNHKPASGVIKLSWYQNAPILKAGELWSLDVKLKKPRNFDNPAAFDYVSSLKRHHISWTGYVLSKAHNQRLDPLPSFSWVAFRERLAAHLKPLFPQLDHLGIVEALSLNITRNIDSEQWDLFRRTGTIHLFGISGEHIAFLFAITFKLFHLIWTRNCRWCLYCPAPVAAAIGSFSLALFFSLLAGFDPPVQRAIIGCFFFCLYRCGIQKLSSWQSWRYALLVVLCIEPHVIMMQGFYFSFLAVAVIFLSQQRWKHKKFFSHFTLQLACLIGLLPLTLFWYDYGSLNGYFANLLSIPLVGFLIMPLCLMVLLLSETILASSLAALLNQSISLLIHLLHWTEHWSWLNLEWNFQNFEVPFICMTSLLLLVILPIRPIRQIIIIWVILVICPLHQTIAEGNAIVDILDVGQGLSVLIRTKNHSLLYDTGDQFFNGNDMGNMVILPFLKNQRITQLDKVVISHPDKDHQGGLQSIIKKIPIGQLIVNTTQTNASSVNCHNLKPWKWDKVKFRFFPIRKVFSEKNNNSCVLQVSTDTHKILFTGDIEQIAEQYLIKKYAQKLTSDLLLIPHHGSKTSTSADFLKTVKPSITLASLGFDNRFHFPHESVTRRLNDFDLPLYTTANCGRLNLDLVQKRPLLTTECNK